MYCENCGTEIKGGQKFCPNCGAPVEAAGSDSAEPNTNVPVSGNKKAGQNRMPMIISIVSVVVIVAVIILVVVSRQSGNTSELTEEEEPQDGGEQASNTAAPATLADGITVSDVTITVNNTESSDKEEKKEKKEEIEASGYVPKFVATGIIQNDNNESCTVTLNFEYEGTTIDNYGDAQTSLDYTTFDFDVPANSTYKIYVDNDSGYKYDQVSYTGKLNTSVSAYTGEEKLLSADAVSDVSHTVNAQSYIDYSMTLSNTTEDRWKTCEVSGVILVNGEYTGDTFSASADYIKPGEEATLTGDIYLGIQNDQLTFVPTDVKYEVDTNY